MKLSQKKLREVMSELGKQSHRKSPRSKEFYSNMGKKSVAKRYPQLDIDSNLP